MTMGLNESISLENFLSFNNFIILKNQIKYSNFRIYP